MSNTNVNVFKDDTYGLYDLKNQYFIWIGNLESLIRQLNYENYGLQDIKHLTFMGINMYDHQNITEKDIRFLVSLEDIPFKHTWGYSKIWNGNLYADRQYVLVKQVNSNQININIFDIWNEYKYKTPNENNSNPLKYYDLPDFRNGHLKGRNSKRMKRKHIKSSNYRRPKIAGIRLEHSRFNEDKKYIPNLTKNSLIDLYFANSTVMNTWKDKKVRHQWEVKLK